MGRPLPLRHRSRPGARRGRTARPSRRATASPRRRRVDGRHARHRVGRDPPRARSNARIVLASTAYATADQIAWCQPQLLAIRNDPDFAGGDYYGTGRAPVTGLGLARRIAHITYRTETELDERFGREAQLARTSSPLRPGDRGPVRRRDLPRPPRRQAREALRRQLLPRAHRGDELPRRRPRPRRGRRRPVPGHRRLHRRVRRHRPALPAATLRRAARRPAGSTRAHITSLFGHDGFLIEEDQVGEIVRAALHRGPRRR